MTSNPTSPPVSNARPRDAELITSIHDKLQGRTQKDFGMQIDCLQGLVDKQHEPTFIASNVQIILKGERTKLGNILKDSKLENPEALAADIVALFDNAITVKPSGPVFKPLPPVTVVRR